MAANKIPHGDHGLSALRQALAHLNAGRLSEAEALCRAVLKATPHEAQAWQLLGGIALQRGEADAAVAHFRQAVSAAPRTAQAHSNLGAALLATGQIEDAIGALRSAIRHDPKYGSAYTNLGDALLKAGRLEEALTALRRAVSLLPTDAKAHTNLGAALTRLQQPDEAVTVLLKAIALNPRMPQAHDNLGGAYSALGQFERAGECHSKALELQPVFRDASQNRAMLYLTMGRFSEGWRDYLERFSVRQMTVPLHRTALEADLSGQRILLGKDQGLGDEVFFLRFAPELKRRGASIAYLAGAKIAALFRRLPFLDAVVDETALQQSWDKVISIGDLPHILAMATSQDAPPSLAIPVLPDRLAEQKAALAAFGPPPYIGVTWRAGLDQARSLFKTVPLARIGAALKQAPGTLVALQRLPEKGEIETLAKAAGRPVHDMTALNDRLEDMLALLSLLDDYVTVSNTNVHLSAAVGRGGRVLVPHPPEFRWMATGATSPWFPGYRVYRQDVSGSWDAAMAALAADLAAGASASRPDAR